MIKKLLIILLFIITAFIVISEENIKIILAGIAIFLIGMNFMEDGFKIFSQGKLESILEKLTKNKFRSILTGFFSTTMVQSSSLISVIVISFLSVELISLTKGISIIFGANLGSTTTAWIVSSLGLKLKISLYAMPMIIFGVLFKFSKKNYYLGFANILLGLGFIFLGIAYMKEGFDTLREAIDLSVYSIDGIYGILFYIFLGAIATVVIQSSGATMAIIITALAGGNILYIDALSLAIGANVGTTVTAILGSLTSNQNGKRLAFGHFIFNIITALMALFLIYQIKDLVDLLSPFLGISENNFSMKLALFHTIFNLIGIIVLYPFIPIIVQLSKTFINEKVKKASKPKYLEKTNITIPYNAIISIQKEVIHLYDNSQKAILHALSMHTTNLQSKEDITKALLNPRIINTNIDDIYQNDLKVLYSKIIEFALKSQQNMNEEQVKYLSELKRSSNMIVKILKDTRDIQINMNYYLNSNNQNIKEEYKYLKKELVTFIIEVNKLKNFKSNELEIYTRIETNKSRLKNLDIINNNKIDDLMKNNKITSKMATSLINDTLSTYNICKNLLKIANVLFIKIKL
ncbi:MAG: Na/Pi cotransporter family protein [Arcobacter sp.]|nr:Na/Pi cotransporter family protein [Arcobacter sp.]